VLVAYPARIEFLTVTRAIWSRVRQLWLCLLYHAGQHSSMFALMLDGIPLVRRGL
jgi:hypothetical protein